MKLFVFTSAVLTLLIAKLSHLQASAAPSYGYQGPPAPLAHDGTVLDTPEVAQAKAAHLAAHAAAAARLTHGYQYDQTVYGYNEDPNAYNNQPAYSSQHSQAYRGPSAPLAHDGRVVDTPEVAQARAAHLAAHAHAASRVGHYNGRYEDDGGYRGQVSIPVPVPVPVHGYAVPVQIAYTHTSHGGYQGPFASIGEDGRVIDTPEVTQARAAHLQAYAHAAALAASEREYAPGREYASGEAQVHEPSSAEGPAHEESYY